jgi:magnesium chelatase family protein
MLATSRTFALDGIDARPVRVEADVHRGLPGFAIVGLPDVAVREARERVRAAMGNCGFDFPQRRITINLAPASLRKAGPGFDLAIATALMGASGQIRLDGLAGVPIAGELALDGAVRPVAGALAMAEAAARQGDAELVLPAANGPEAALAGGVRVLPVESLAQIGALAAGEWKPPAPRALTLSSASNGDAPDLADLRGQAHLRFALEVAAAGGHSLLMVGPPGAGKSLAARRLPSILPMPTSAEALEIARVASACGSSSARGGSRPFRAPHHTISAAGLIGGGNPPRAGEVTLAHGGVLFLDELCEFRRDALEALRAPLETGWVSIGRSGAHRSLPCSFMLVAAANPCPCGRGEEDGRCTCAVQDVRRYQGRLSGALADRIDIVVPVAQPRAAEIGGGEGERSADVGARVGRARERQRRRLGPGRCNAAMTPAEARATDLSEEAAALLSRAYEAQGLSGRAHDRVLRLARTIADLDGEERVDAEAVGRALGLRRREDR